MRYTTNDYLNKMIAIAIDDGTITANDIYVLIDQHGGNCEDIMIEIISIIWERKKDSRQLRDVQGVFNEYRADRGGRLD